MIKEHNLVNLGFDREDISSFESGGNPTHYYTYNFGHPQYGLCLITNCENEVEKDGGWFVELFEVEGFKRITDLNELMDFFVTLKKLEQ